MLELLNEIAPHVARVAICPTQMLTRPVGSLRRWLRLRGLRVEVVTAPMRGSNEIEAAMAQWGSEPNFGLIVVPDPAMKQDREMAEDVRFGSCVTSIAGPNGVSALACSGTDQLAARTQPNHRAPSALVGRAVSSCPPMCP
jgi:hypothetical protein